MSSEDSGPEVTKPRTRKRIRKDLQGPDAPAEPPIKRVRGKQGKLKEIMNMPIEVFTEIAKYLYPIDLILLSRASKFFRQLLLNRSATKTWQYALSNVDGLPPCPKGLCEPQYAALVFSKYCSMCGKQAPRPMDPVLRVRLCASCRDQHVSHVEDHEHGLVPTSWTILPAKGGGFYFRCLRKDSAELDRELDALRLAGDRLASSRWVEQRRREMEQRKEDAQPLADFLAQQGSEQNDSLAARRGQRESDRIRFRLLELGWVEGDFEMREKDGTKRWKSLVCVAKPLTERTHFASGTQPRAAPGGGGVTTQAAACFKDLSMGILRTCRGVSGVLDRHVQGKHDDDSDSKGENKALKAPFPSHSLIFDCEPFEQLVDTDASMEDFEETLMGMGPALDQFLVEWKANLEKALVQRLPCDTRLLMENSLALDEEPSTASDLAPEPAIEVDSQPIRNLPLEIQLLLRADVVWDQTYSSSPHFYPESFRGFYSSTADSISFSAKTSEIAKALLIALGCPNATYLAMKAAGPVFTCGRCRGHKSVTWGEMLQHYLGEQKKWDDVQNYPSFRERRLVYVFTHDAKKFQGDKPLVRMANDEEKEAPYHSTYSIHRCITCFSVGPGFSFHQTESDAIDHVCHVHLVQNPLKDVHYR
ncbi:hypothetical protein FRC10_005281 [Ceratobasidium sp. 414]|nr:hypothetical protein FRC10_005281 [Ceratobasidium sp. 414]